MSAAIDKTFPLIRSDDQFTEEIKPHTGLIEKYDEDGNLTEQYYEVNGKMEGEHLSFYDNEVVKLRKHYVNGKREGVCYAYNSKSEVIGIEYYSKGRLHGECIEFVNKQVHNSRMFNNGQLHGLSKSFYITNGKIMLEIYYEFNKRHGSYRKYHPNGIIGLECNYKNGELDGRFIIYNSDGDIIYETYYINGAITNHKMQWLAN